MNMMNSTSPLNPVLLTAIKPEGKPITLIPGEIVNAEIIDILASGGITLKIKGCFLTGKAEIALQKDSTAFFKVLVGESGRELRLQFLGYSDKPVGEQARHNQQGSLIDKIFQELSGALLTKGTGTKSFSELIERLFGALPVDVNSLPIEGGIQIQTILRESLESSGFFQAFLPFPWKGLKDGDLSFKRARSGEKESYSCRLNLDLARLGRLSVILLMLNKEFFLYFKIDNAGFREILCSCIDELKGRFIRMGSPLRVTFLDKDVSFEEMERIESCERMIDIKA